MGWDSATFTDKGTGRKDSMSKSGEGRCKGRFKTEKEVLKQDNDVLKQKTRFYNTITYKSTLLMFIGTKL